MKITQVFTHYEKWEDYQNGMYRTNNNVNVKELKGKAKSLLCDIALFRHTMNLVLDNWPVATSVNLTNLGCNRKAWLGAAVCCYLYQVPEIITRLAWADMTEAQQRKANTAAAQVIKKYEKLKFSPYAQEEIRF